MSHIVNQGRAFDEWPFGEGSFTMLAMAASSNWPDLPDTAPTGRSRVPDGCFLAASALILIAFRLHAFDLPLEADEANYAYIASRILEGDRLYVDLWDHQPPGVFAMFAGLIAAFGDSPGTFRWTATAFSLLSLVLVYRIARQVCGESRAAPACAALLFALASSDPGTAGEGCQREIYMNAFVLLAWWLILRTARCGARRDRMPVCGTTPLVADPFLPDAKGQALPVFLAGLALGAGSTFKTVLAVHWLILAGWLALSCQSRGTRGDPSRRPAGFSGGLRAILVFALGPAALWGSIFGYFLVTGRWHEFLDAVFQFNLGYSEGDGGFGRFAAFFAPFWHRYVGPINPPPKFPFIFDSALPLWIMGGAALLVLPPRVVSDFRRGASPGPTLLILALVLSNFLAVCLPGRFWPHYYHLMIPSLVLGLVTAFEVLLSERAMDLAPDAAPPLGLRRESVRRILCGASVVALGFAEYRHYLSQPPFGLTVQRYNSRDFWGRAQGWNAAAATEPGDRVFVFGNDPEIYYYARRKCASRYTMITGLGKGLPGAEERRRTLLEELRRDPPRIILVLFDEDPFPEWLSFLREFYGEPVGWDYHDQTRKPIMFVLARKDRPIREVNWDWDRAEVGGWFLGEK